MRIDKIATGRNVPHDVNVVVEVPVGGEPIKYELDKESGTLVVDRFLYTSMRYPGNYGFIPHTLSGDGDPVDVLIANSRTFPKLRSPRSNISSLTTKISSPENGSRSCAGAMLMRHAG
jgi:inorganic pyrophosphatase